MRYLKALLAYLDRRAAEAAAYDDHLMDGEMA